MIACEHCGGQHGDAHRYCPRTRKIFAPQRFFPPGMLLDEKYRLGALVGAGGMGAVFEATHVLLDKRVAVKLMLPELSRDREMVARMTREARAASASGHPNIAMVTDMGRTETGALFVVMELLKGETVGALVQKSGRLPLRQAVGYALQMLAGLEAVHRLRIIHRDLKPDNLIISADGEEGTLKILDFGISKFADEESLRLTDTGRILGSPFYMAPEQARGLPGLDHRVDIYAAGAVLYYMLSGSPPVEESRYADLVCAIIEGRLIPISERVPGLPANVASTVMCALARQPENRFADAQSFGQALEASLADEGTKRVLADTMPNRQSPASGETGAPQSTLTGPSRPAVAPRFAPTPLAASPIELAEPRRQRRGTLYTPKAKRRLPRLGRPLAVVAFVFCALFLAHRYLAPRWKQATRPSEIRIDLSTKPDDAEVYVDGVMTGSRPILLPRAESGKYRIRVQASGYRTRVLTVSSAKSQVLSVQLEAE